MHKEFLLVRAIGFDLDRTLYKDSPEMNSKVTNEVALRVLEKYPELRNIEKVRELYEEEARKLGSWPKVLAKLAFSDPVKILHDCLESANILSFIKKDEELVKMMDELGKKYYLFLITGSSENFSISVLGRLGIDLKLFKFTLFGDNPFGVKKTDNSAFKYFLSRYLFLPRESVYVGDNPVTDIIIPKSLGMKAVAVGKHVKEADFSVDNIHYIRPLFI